MVSRIMSEDQCWNGSYSQFAAEAENWYAVPATFVDNYMWCRDNIDDKWGYFCSGDTPSAFYFKNKDDAIRFKLIRT